MTFFCEVNRLVGMFQDVSLSLTSSSKCTILRSDNVSMRIVVINLLIEQELNMESIVTVLLVPDSSVPKAAVSSSLPSRITARLKPTTEYCSFFRIYCYFLIS